MTARGGAGQGRVVDMRWELLFDDLEAQAQAAAAAELAGEVADRTRRERALVELVDRVVAGHGSTLLLRVAGGATYEGTLADVAQQWCVLRTPAPVLVPMAAVTSVSGLGTVASTTGREGVRRRITLASALRAVSRDRSPVRIDLVDGSTLTGTLDSVGADHVDVAEHPADQPRRHGSVRSVRTVPFSALAGVRPAPGSSTLGD
jgi:hypothetical protein